MSLSESHRRRGSCRAARKPACSACFLGSIGTIQATEAIKLILGVGETLAGRLLLVDALRMSFRTIRLRRDPDCPACGTRELKALIDYDEFCASARSVARDAAVATGVREIAPRELAERLRRGDSIDLIDVREPYEWRIARIDGARLIPLGRIRAPRWRSYPADRDSCCIATTDSAAERQPSSSWSSGFDECGT